MSANGVTRFGISTYPIKNSYLVIPPLNEQKTISKYLYKKFAEIGELII
jgi:type I restriction enzyme S subunit